jgi:scyllo-inositol 2-dehydrogenase (NADP+)
MKRALVVGIGKMGVSHLAILGGIDGARSLVAVEPTALVRKMLKKVSHDIEVIKSLEDALSKYPYDYAIVATPPATHFSITELLIKRGIPVFLEKPVSVSEDMTESLFAMSVESGVHVSVGYVNRYNPVFSLVRETVRTGDIGPVVSISSEMRGPVVTRSVKPTWRTTPSLGGGCLFDYASHAIDLVTYFTDGRLTVEDANGRSIFSYGVPDEIEATLGISENAMASVYANWSDASLRKATNSVRVVGSKGTISADKSEFILESTDQPTMKKSIVDLSGRAPFYLRGEEFTEQLQDFVSYVSGNSSNKPKNSIERTIETDRILHRIASVIDSKSDRGKV